MCDELGLYIVDEANIETHHFNKDGYPLAYLANKAEWHGAFLVCVGNKLKDDTATDVSHTAAVLCSRIDH